MPRPVSRQYTTLPKRSSIDITICLPETFTLSNNLKASPQYSLMQSSRCRSSRPGATWMILLGLIRFKFLMDLSAKPARPSATPSALSSEATRVSSLKLAWSYATSSFHSSATRDRLVPAWSRISGLSRYFQC